MFDNVTFTSVAGEHTGHTARLIGLSTCGFCRRGKAFLEEKKVAFEYVYLDENPTDLKAQVKDEFYQTFRAFLSYPSLIVDNETLCPGFVKSDWCNALGITDYAENY